MLIFTLRRLRAAAVLLFLVLTATFFLIHIAPGDPMNLLADPQIPLKQRQVLAEFYGLDKPLHVQYWIWLTHALQGDWGISIAENRPAFEIVLERLPNTAILVFAAVLLEYTLGILLGLIAVARAGTWIDESVRFLGLALFAVPSFWLALVGIELFSVRWPIFPTTHMRSLGSEHWPFWRQILDVLHHVALPATVLALSRFGGLLRFVRTGVLEILNQDYIRTARAIGVPERRILWRHALPNALAPIIHRFGVALPILLSGSVILEVIFSWPGLGQASFKAINGRDYPVIMATTALAATFVVLGSLLADLLHAWLDPRARQA